MKPANFLLGKGKDSNKLYIIDLGFVEKFTDSEGQQFTFSEGHGLRGPSLFASVWNHYGSNEVWWHAFVFLFKGLVRRNKEKENDYGDPTDNKDEINNFTYGFGIQIPVYKLTKIPLNINFDYTSLPQVSYSNEPIQIMPKLNNFRTYSIKINWMIKK